jgi:DNA-binding FrmR family transcriptional regulator
MSHTIRQRQKLLNRVHRLRGQVDSIARALEAEKECGEVLRLIAASRGAMNSLMALVIEDHVREHAFAHARPGSAASSAAEDLIDVVRSYLK